MNTQTLLTLVAIAMAFLWGYLGWLKGAVVEVRGLLVTYFSLLAAMRLWHPVSEILNTLELGDSLSVFLGLSVPFFAARILVSYALNNRAKTYKPAEDNTPDKSIGAVAGFVSGLLMGSTLALLVTVVTAGWGESSSQSAPNQIEKIPVALFRFVENDLVEVQEKSRAFLPVVIADPKKPISWKNTFP